MKQHRFYIGPVELQDHMDIHDAAIVHQWFRVLRFRADREVVLFNEQSQQAVYRIDSIDKKQAAVTKRRDMQPEVPTQHVQLCFALLKKDKNELVLQKATELGVSVFAPLISDRCDRPQVSAQRMERWQLIVREAAEQCGRSDIPQILPVSTLAECLDSTGGSHTRVVAEQHPDDPQSVAGDTARSSQLSRQDEGDCTPTALFVGPEGGWSDAEKARFAELADMQYKVCSQFTLRAETASIVAVSQIFT